MKKFLHTIFINSRYFVFHYILVLLFIVAIANLIMLYIKRKKEHSELNYFNYIKQNFKKDNVYLSLIFAYFVLPIWATVFSRFKNPRQDPFANIFGGWGIFELEYFFDLSVIWNLIMFAPMLFCIYYLFKIAKNKRLSLTPLAITTTFISLLYSGIIEGLQIIFRVGTFQISDLVYNTLGSIIGSIIAIIIIKALSKR